MKELAIKRATAEKTLRNMNAADYNKFAKEAFSKGYKLGEFASYLVKKDMGWA